MKWTVLFSLVVCLGCNGENGGPDDTDDAGPEDSGPEPSHCTTEGLGGPQRVSQVEDGDAVWPSIIMAGERVYVAWYTTRDDEDPLSVERVFVAEIDTTGAPQGDPLLVGDGRAPTLGISGGQVAMAYRETGIDRTNVLIQLVDPGPSLTAGAALPGAEPATTPSIVGAPGNDGYGVAFTVDPSDLSFVRLDASGMTAEPDPDPIIESTIFAKPRALATDTGFAVVFLVEAALRVAIVDDAGSLVGEPATIGNRNFVPWDQYLSTLTAVRGNDTIYVLNDNGEIAASPDHHLFLSAIGLDGSLEIPSHTMTVAPGPARNPTAAWTGDGLAAVWSDGRVADSELAAALLDPDGNAVGGFVQLTGQRGDAEMSEAVWTGSEGLVTYSAGAAPERTINVQRFDCTL